MERKVIFIGGRKHGKMELIIDDTLSKEAEMEGYCINGSFYEDKTTKYHVAYLKDFNRNAVEAMMKNFLPHYFVPSPSYEYFPEDIYTKKVAAFEKTPEYKKSVDNYFKNIEKRLEDKILDDAAKIRDKYAGPNTGGVVYENVKIYPLHISTPAEYKLDTQEPVVFFSYDDVEKTFEEEKSKSAWDTQLEKELKNGDDTWGKIAKKYK